MKIYNKPIIGNVFVGYIDYLSLLVSLPKSMDMKKIISINLYSEVPVAKYFKLL
jgi:hypothetical protein